MFVIGWMGLIIPFLEVFCFHVRGARGSVVAEAVYGSRDFFFFGNVVVDSKRCDVNRNGISWWARRFGSIEGSEIS